MATIFSKIAQGEIPSYKIAESEAYYAFLDVNPLVKGHTLVIPRQEVDYIFDMEPEGLAGLVKFAQEVAAKIKKSIDCKKVAIMVIGLEVPHAHIHLIPINKMSDVDFSREKLQLTPDEFEEVREKIVNS